ncbi:MAG: hypothetical protein K8T20_01970, partial [Planctomycetes bacterium]|nr:hypothetical protein [Planctomycetota bacterium]
MLAREKRQPSPSAPNSAACAESRAFYTPASSVYADPFEISPFAKAWRAAGGDPARVLAALRQSGIT